MLDFLIYSVILKSKFRPIEMRCQMSKPNQKLLRTKEAAEVLGVKASAIRVVEKRGLLHAVRDWSGHRRFEEGAVLELRRKLLSGECEEEPSAAGGNSTRISKAGER